MSFLGLEGSLLLLAFEDGVGLVGSGVVGWVGLDFFRFSLTLVFLLFISVRVFMKFCEGLGW